MDNAFVAQLKEVMSEEQVEEVKGKVVIFPADTVQLSNALKLVYQNEVKLTVRKRPDDDLEGYATTLVLDLGKMNSVVEIDKHNVTATVQSGMTLDQFRAQIGENGFCFPPISIWDYNAYLVEALGTNAIGLNSLKHGRWREFILGLEVVLPTGEVIELGGKNIKFVSGLDVMGLFVGSKATLGIPTRMLMRLLPKPETSRLLVSAFANLTDAVNAVGSLAKRGLAPARNEILTPGLASDMQLKDFRDGSIAVVTAVEGFVESLDRQVGEIKVAYKKFGVRDMYLVEQEAEIARMCQSYFACFEKYKDDFYYNLTVLPVHATELIEGILESSAKSDLELEMLIHGGLVNVELFLKAATQEQTRQFEELLKKKVRLLGGRMASEKLGIGSHIKEVERLEAGLQHLFDPKQVMTG